MRIYHYYHTYLSFLLLLITAVPASCRRNSRRSPFQIRNILRNPKTQPPKWKQQLTLKKINDDSKKRKSDPEEDRSRILQNLLAGLASAIALIPEASTFAMTAGLNPLVINTCHD